MYVLLVSSAKSLHVCCFWCLPLELHVACTTDDHTRKKYSLYRPPLLALSPCCSSPPRRSFSLRRDVAPAPSSRPDRPPAYKPSATHAFPPLPPLPPSIAPPRSQPCPPAVYTVRAAVEAERTEPGATMPSGGADLIQKAKDPGCPEIVSESVG